MGEKNGYLDFLLGIDRNKKPAPTSKARKPDRFSEITAKYRDRRARKGAEEAIDKAFGIEVQERR